MEPPPPVMVSVTGISEVAMIVFVRKHAPEIQYLKACISEEQRQEFGRMVETTVDQIETGHFVFCFAQWHSFPPKRLCQLSPPGFVSQRSGISRGEPCPQGRSE